MRQFDVIENPNEASRGYAPYVVILQSHHLAPLDTVFVAPLVRDRQLEVSALDVRVELSGEPFILALTEAASIRRWGAPRTRGAVGQYEDAIRRAFERLMTGF